MNAFQMLIKSPAFWTALFSALGLIGLKYLHIPEDVWNVTLGFLGVVVTILTADGAVKTWAREQRKLREEELSVDFDLG